MFDVPCSFPRIDIFTASWGPKDDGETVEAPGHLALTALKNGIANVRKRSIIN
jgi:hypothetical protein